MSTTDTAPERLPGPRRPAQTEPLSLTVDGSEILIRHLVVSHAEAAAVLGSHLDEGGTDAASELLRRAIPVGLTALAMSRAAVDTGALTRTLDGFAERVDQKSALAMSRLEASLEQLSQGEQTVAATARNVLAQLPAQVDAVLAGEAASVRQAVADAARSVQAAGIQQLTAALAEHSQAVRNAISLDREGPVQMLRQELVGEIHSTRREITEQLNAVRGLVEAAHAHRAGAAKSSRAIGAEWEAQAMAIADTVVTAAGDRFEATGSRPGDGTSRRTGDGVATLQAAISGKGEPVRIVLEAKKRSRPLTAADLRREITAARQVRHAAAGIVLVPTADEVPGNGRLARVDDMGYVVAADDEDTVSLVYLLVRELVALLTVRQRGDGGGVDVSQLEARLNATLTAVEEFDEVGRLAGQASKSLDRLLEVGKRAQAKARDSLTQGIALLHP